MAENEAGQDIGYFTSPREMKFIGLDNSGNSVLSLPSKHVYHKYYLFFRYISLFISVILDVMHVKRRSYKERKNCGLINAAVT